MVVCHPDEEEIYAYRCKKGLPLMMKIAQCSIELQSVKVCDATGDAMKNKSRSQKTLPVFT